MTARRLLITVDCGDTTCNDCAQFEVGGRCSIYGPLDPAGELPPRTELGYPGTRPKRLDDTFGDQYKRHEDCLSASLPDAGKPVVNPDGNMAMWTGGGVKVTAWAGDGSLVGSGHGTLNVIEDLPQHIADLLAADQWRKEREAQ